MGWCDGNGENRRGDHSGNEDSGGRAGSSSSLREFVDQMREEFYDGRRCDQLENALIERTDRAIGEMRGCPHQAGESPPSRRRWVSRHIGDSGQ